MNNLTLAEIDQELRRRGELPEENVSHQQERAHNLTLAEIDQELRRRGELPEENAIPESSFGQGVASLGKGLLAGGIGGALDTAALPYNAAAGIHNFQKETERQTEALPPEQQQRMEQINKFIVPNPLELASNALFPQEAPYIPSAQEGIEEGIDKLSGGYTKTPERLKPLYEGVKFSGAIAAPGSLAKGFVTAAPKVAKALSSIGSLKKSDIGGAAVTGATIEATKDKLGEGGALGTGLAAGIGTQVGGSFSRAGLKNVVARSLSKKFRNDIYEAAKDVNVPLPLAAVTDSKMVKFLNENISKYPVFGEKIHKAFEETSTAFQKSMENLLDSVGTEGGVKKNSRITNAYKRATEALPENAVIGSEKILNKIDEIRKKFKSFTNSDDKKKLMNTLEDVEKATSITGAFGRFSPPLPMDMVINTKADLNRISKDTDSGVKLMFRNLNSAFSETIKDYGKINPEWYKKFTEAEKLFGRTARREKIETALQGKLYNPITQEVNYNSLINTLLTGKKKEILKNSFGKDNYKNVEKFIDAARGVIKGKDAVNKSGTASQMAVYSFLINVPALMWNNPTALGSYGATVYGLHKISKLLVDKELVELISKYAKNPTPSLAESISKTIRNRSGASLEALNHEVKSTVDNDEKEKYKSREKINRFNNIKNTI